MSTPTPVPPATGTVAAIEAKVDAILAALEAKAKAEEVTLKAVFGKYWPIAAGAIIAATRLL
jgi:hypothetical protein